MNQRHAYGMSASPVTISVAPFLVNKANFMTESGGPVSHLPLVEADRRTKFPRLCNSSLDGPLDELFELFDASRRSSRNAKKSAESAVKSGRQYSNQMYKYSRLFWTTGTSLGSTSGKLSPQWPAGLAPSSRTSGPEVKHDRPMTSTLFRFACPT